MNYNTHYWDRRTPPYSYRINYYQSYAPLSSVPTLSRTPNMVPFKVCKIDRDRNNIAYIEISEDKTLRQLKEEILKTLDLKLTHVVSSLERWNDYDYAWVALNDSDDYKTIADMRLSSYTTLNMKTSANMNETVQSNLSKVDDKTLTLKFCRKPMDMSDYEYITVPSSMTIAQLKEEARKYGAHGNTSHLLLWKTDRWIQYDNSLDDITIAESELDRYSMLSFATEDDLIPGLCGLKNLGNTCFMNSALQCLSNIPEFTKNILSLSNEINAPIIGAYATLIKDMWSGKHAVIWPSSLLLNISENLPRYRQYRQQDAQEFMNYFLHLMHEELTNEKTLITKLFYGQLQSSVKCLGGCGFIDNSEEAISFLPIPVDNDTNQYEILYLSSNGEQKLVSIRTSATTIDLLVDLFIEQHEPKLSRSQIKVVSIWKNTIVDEYSIYTSLNRIVKCELAFIEVPEKTVEQSYTQLMFLNYETREPFRPPIYIIRPTYGCRYSDLSTQIDRIQNYIGSVAGVPTSAYHISWVGYGEKISYLNMEINKDNPEMIFIKQINLEIDSKWIDQNINKFNIERSSGHRSLKNLINDFFREDSLSGDYYCSKCSALTKARQITNLVLPLPRALIIQLKRFTYDVYSTAKIDTFIDFPLQDLDLSEYIIGGKQKKRNESTKYDLVAVCNHTGSLVCGHYTTYAKNHQNNKWYSFNDEYIREISDDKDIVTKNAYILVYILKPNT